MEFKMSKLMRKKITLILLLCFIALPTSFAAVSTKPQEAEISARMREDISALLDKLVGLGKSKVFISVTGEMISKSKSESGTPEEDIVTLPGYSSVNILQKTNDFIKKQKGAAEHTSEFKITKITTSIVLDSTIEQTKANTIKLLVSDIMRLDAKRGDSITLLKADMLPWWKSFMDSHDNRKIILIAAIATLILAIIAIIAYGLASNLFRTIIDYARISAMNSRGEMGSGGGGVTQIQDVAGGGSPGDTDGEFSEVMDAEGTPIAGLLESESAFGFIENLPTKEISEILMDEPPEDIAVIIANLTDQKPHISSRLLLSFPNNIRQEITKEIINLKEAEPERLMEIENNIRMKIEKSLKGSDKLSRLLSIIDADERSTIIDNLPNVDPKDIDKIKDSLVTFDDICALDVKNLKPITLALPYKDWATGLQGIPSSALRHVINVYPDDLKAIVKDLLINEVEREQVIAARAKIISTAIELDSKGKISLKGLRA
jgi:FliG C-terminal domain/FliG middle domain